jgi:thymidine kinase
MARAMTVPVEVRTEPVVGSIDLFIGPMFSGKTDALIAMARRLAFAKISCLIIKYGKDVRYAPGDAVASCNKQFLVTAPETKEMAAIRVESVLHLSEVCKIDDLAKVSEGAVLIDEGQWFEGLVAYATGWAALGKRIGSAALDGDVDKKPMGEVLQLIPHCDAVTKLRAVCMKCRNRDAPFTTNIAKLSEGKHIGGKDAGYLSVCRQCHPTI